MDAFDVECPKCEAAIGYPCINSEGVPLGYGGRTVKGFHPARWDALAQQDAEWSEWPQGQLKAALREASTKIVSLKETRPVSTVDVACKERVLKSWYRRYSSLWSRLGPGSRPAVKRYTATLKKDIPHPELIECPIPTCKKPTSEPCFPEKEGLTAYHISRVRLSP